MATRWGKKCTDIPLATAFIDLNLSGEVRENNAISSNPLARAKNLPDEILLSTTEHMTLQTHEQATSLVE